MFTDNMINQAILSTWMKKHKIKCSVASNGQEAVERWKGGGFHLVLVRYHDLARKRQESLTVNIDGYSITCDGRN